MDDELELITVTVASALAGLTVAVTAYLALSRPRRAGGAASRRGRSPRHRETNPLKQLLAVMPGLGPLAEAFVPRSARSAIADVYVRAGEPGRVDSTVLAVGALVAGAGLSVVFVIFLTMLLGGLWPFLGLAGLLLGPSLVQSHLGTLAKQRMIRIRQAMPYVLDLVVLTTRAGSSLPLALRRCTMDFANHPLGREFERVLVDMEVGAPRRVAFEAMLARCETEEMRAFVDTVLIAEELGRPVSDALEQLSDRLRVNRVQAAESAAGAAGVYVALPTMLVFISVLLLLFAPFFVKWITGAYDL